MAKRMLIDATQPEETRVAVVSGNRLEEYDFETSSKKQLKGNIYLAKVVRVEPSLQAAFVEYGGNRHGFLAFSEIHPDYYKIPVEDRQALIAEEREIARAEDRMDAMGIDSEASTATVERPATRPELQSSAVSEILPADGETGEAEPGEGEHIEESGEAVDPLEPQEAEPRDPAPDGDGHEAGEGVESAPEAGPDEAGEAHPFDAAGFESEPLEALGPDAAAPAEGEVRAEPDAPEDPSEAPAAAVADAETVPAADAEPGARQAEAREPVETVGGEEAEIEMPRRRAPSRRYKIQEVIKRRQVMLVQVTKEERGTKGAALTTRLSLAGRYCVLMPNTGRGGGISRKISNMDDRKKLRDIVDTLDIPEGISVIVRTAGAKRTKAEIKRDFDYLLRLWSDIRELTLKSTAPALIYEEANLIKRSIRDLYARDMDDILVEGEDGYKLAKEFMRTLMPSHAKRVKPYRSTTVPLFQKFQIEGQIAAIHQPVTRLKSGGYIVINQTEALVAIDVNSGRATRERNIEETALQTNLEAADEISRQLRLRDLAGLIVIDFIDMESQRNQRAVEKRLKDALKNDRARIQLGRISHFGLLEMSRQRLRPSLHEFSTERCPHCQGTGVVRSTESTALQVLRAVEEEGLKRRNAEIAVSAPPRVALYILNQKRPMLTAIEARHRFRVLINEDEALVPPDFRIEVLRTRTPDEMAAAEDAARKTAALEPTFEAEPEPEPEAEETEEAAEEAPQERGEAESSEGFAHGEGQGEGERGHKRRRRGKRGGRRRRGRGGKGAPGAFAEHAPGGFAEELPVHTGDQAAFEAAVHAAESARESGEEDQDGPDRESTSAREGERPGGERGEGGRRRRRRRRGRGGNGAKRPGAKSSSGEGAAPAEPGAQEESHEPAARDTEPRAPARAEERAAEPVAADQPKRRGWWQRLVE